jgi:hypothetical protein
MIVHYNPFNLKYLPEKYIEKYSEYLHPEFLDFRKEYTENTNRFSSWVYKSFQSFIDRTGTTENLVKVTNLYPHVKYDRNFNKSFETLCDERARALLKENRKINIYWSGGLDSTTMLFVFLNNIRNKDQITVKLNYNSILESGYLFDTYIKDQLNYTIETVQLEALTFNEEEIYLTGHPADQISFVNTQFTDPILINKENMNSESLLQDHIEEKIYRFFEPALDKFPKKINTVSDFYWFCGYNYRWQNACLAPFHIINNKNLKTNYRDVVRGFYDNKEFEQWSMSNTEKDPEDRDSKIYTKKLIRKLGGEEIEDYVKNKKRNPSVYVNYNRNYLLTNKDFENIYISDDVLKEIIRNKNLIERGSRG